MYEIPFIFQQFCHQYIPEVAKYMPKCYGECGRYVVVQSGGTPLQNYLNQPWQVSYLFVYLFVCLCVVKYMPKY